VKNDRWRDQVVSQMRIKQGYLTGTETVTVRIRVAGEQAWLTIKGALRGFADWSSNILSQWRIRSRC
jgi:adenylate cyclase